MLHMRIATAPYQGLKSLTKTLVCRQETQTQLRGQLVKDAMIAFLLKQRDRIPLWSLQPKSNLLPVWSTTTSILLSCTPAFTSRVQVWRLPKIYGSVSVMKKVASSTEAQQNDTNIMPSTPHHIASHNKTEAPNHYTVHASTSYQSPQTS